MTKCSTKLITGAVVSVVLFATLLETGSWAMLRFTSIRHFPRSHMPVRTWEEVSQSSGSSDRELAKSSQILLSWRNLHPEIDDYVRILPQKHEPGDYSFKGEKQGKSLFSGTYEKLTPGLDDDFVLKSAASGKIKYRMHIKTDRYGRRLTGYESGEGRSVNVIFLGCSVTLGDGVNDEETFASLFGKKVSNARTFNFGVTGASPSTILSTMQASGQDFFAGVDRALPTVAVLTLIDDHFRRVSGTSLVLSQTKESLLLTPAYFLEKGELKKDENFFSDPWKLRHLNAWYGSTHFAEFSRFEFPWIDGDQYQLMASVIREIESEFRRSLPAFRKIYVSYYVEQGHHLMPFKEYLQKINIPVVGNPFFDLLSLMKFHNEMPSDPHPSTLSHDLMSEFLKEQIDI